MRVKLENVCLKGSSNLKQSDVIDKNGEYEIYGASGLIGKVDFFHQEKPYIAVVKDGAGIGRTMLLPEKSSVIGTMQYILPNEKVTPKYLYYVIRYMHLEKYFTGATIPHIYFKDYRKEEFNLCDLLEQEKIVSTLSKIETLITHLRTQLEKLDLLVKARFVEMFGDININDKKWECKPLGELCTIIRGSSPRPIEKFLGGDVPWIKIGDATEGDNVYLTSTREHIIKDGVKKSRLVKSGSLIFANCGVSLGFARIITFDGCIHDGWLAMEDINEKLDKVFLLQSLNQMTEHFRAIAPAGTQPNLNTLIMKAYKQIIPPIEIQKDFIYFVKQVDQSKSILQQELDKAQTLFDSLMQEYFG